MADKKVPVRLEQRTISGRGLVKIPQDKNIRILYCYFRVIRLPKINFTNSKYNPDRSEYAKLTYLRNDYVLKDEALHFESELKTWEQDPIGYLAYANVCFYNSIIAYFDYICVRLSIPPLLRTGLIYVEPLQNLPDTIKVVCRDDTAIIADIWRYDYDLACPEADSDSPPPPDPPPFPQVPPGTPIGDISPPYNSPNDGGDTVPNPSDETAPPPNPGLGEPCTIVTVYYTVRLLTGEEEQRQIQLYAPIYDVYLLRGTPGDPSYSENVFVDATIQQPDKCDTGGHEIVYSGTAATTPVYDSVVSWYIL